MCAVLTHVMGDAHFDLTAFMRSGLPGIGSPQFLNVILGKENALCFMLCTLCFVLYALYFMLSAASSR
jgi:hypothetical protein